MVKTWFRFLKLSTLPRCVNNEDFISKAGKSNHQMWNELCDMISKNPTKIQRLNVDAIIRSGLRRYTDQVHGSHIIILIIITKVIMIIEIIIIIIIIMIIMIIMVIMIIKVLIIIIIIIIFKICILS